MHICTDLPISGNEIKFWNKNPSNGQRSELGWMKRDGGLFNPFLNQKLKQENKAFISVFKTSILYEIIGSYSSESMNRMNGMWYNLRKGFNSFFSYTDFIQSINPGIFWVDDLYEISGLIPKKCLKF